MTAYDDEEVPKIDGRAMRVQISRENQPPLNVGACRIRMWANGVIDLELDHPYRFGSGPDQCMTRHLTTSISRVIIAWDAEDQ